MNKATVYYHGPILTMEADAPMPQAVRVENGRITYVGDLSTAKGEGDVAVSYTHLTLPTICSV